MDTVGYVIIFRHLYMPFIFTLSLFSDDIFWFSFLNNLQTEADVELMPMNTDILTLCLNKLRVFIWIHLCQSFVDFKMIAPEKASIYCAFFKLSLIYGSDKIFCFPLLSTEKL